MELCYDLRMNIKTISIETATPRIVQWSEKYAVGIECIDKQHMELVRLTNQLYKACVARTVELDSIFKESMSKMVEYVKFHFSTELKLLESINYPDYQEHKNQHDQLVKEILIAVKEFGEGHKFVPNKFVRTLEDWVFGHIAFYDQQYALYVKDQKKKGLLSDDKLICSIG